MSAGGWRSGGRVSDAVVELDGVQSVAVDFTVMSDDERALVREKLHGHDHAAPAEPGQAKVLPFAGGSAR